MWKKLAGVALRTSLLYVFIAGLWTVLWEIALKLFVHDPGVALRLHNYEWWFLVVATAVLLYFVLLRQVRWLEKEVGGRVQAEQLMRESQTRFVTIFRSSPMGITLSRLDSGKFVDANPAILKTLGYSREELVGHTARELDLYTSPDERDRMVDVMRTESRVENAELQFRKKSGEIGTMLGSAELIDLADEAHVLAMMLDISDRKQAEDSCRESETLYHAVFEHSLAALAILEEDGIISLANTQLCKALGYSKEEVEGKMKWTDLLVPGDLARLKEAHEARVANPENTPVQYECRVKRKDGSVMHGFIRVAAIPGTTKTIFSGMQAVEGTRGAEDAEG
jgi:PAS domain S-box-containing protein